MVSSPRFAALILRKLPALAAAAFTFAAAPIASAQSAQGWDATTIGGREYVSVEGIKRFYGFTKLTRTGNRVVLENAKLEVKLVIGGYECLMNNVKFVFSNKVEAVGTKVLVSRLDLTKLIDPVIRPKFIANAGNFRTVILDPGHGGKDPGATNPLGNEAAYNLNLATRVKPLLERAGFRVILTRSSDKFLSLQERVDFANAIREDAVFISIHFNSGGRQARGIETFTLSPPGVAHYGRGAVSGDAIARAGNTHDSANIALATAVHGSLLQRLGTNTFDRGIKRARFSVLSGVRHPAILMEGGFMSHPTEARLIHSEAYQNALATGVCQAIVRYKMAVTKKPAAPTPR
jgi:N-acetylmuramoyl-L-alanine amidase